MAYCTKCGSPFKDGANFCSHCGAAANANQTNDTKRNVHFDGELFKCPSCGALWNTMATTCPSCGYERRGAKAVASAREFNADIERIAANPYYTEDEKQAKIKDKVLFFPIPNTKEDLFEFISMARARKDKAFYGAVFTEAEQELAGAWAAKYEELYLKAKMSFSDSPEFAELERIYRRDHKSSLLGRIRGFFTGG